MGRDKSAKYHKTIKEQIYERLQGMLHIGESKRQTKAEGVIDDKIFSWSTYQSYHKHLNYFGTWV